MITVWIFRKHLFTGKIPVFPLRMLRALPRSLLRGCLGVQIQRGQSSKMVLSDSRAFEALGFQTSLRCTTPTHSQRSLVSDLQQEASELVFFCLILWFFSQPWIWPNTLTRFLSTWKWNGSASLKVQAISVSCFTWRKIATSPGLRALTFVHVTESAVMRCGGPLGLSCEGEKGKNFTNRLVQLVDSY